MSTIEERVIRKIRARAKVGKAKYGVTMDRKDLSLVEWLVHAQEEAMDLAVYLEKGIRELHKKEKVCKWKPTALGWCCASCCRKVQLLTACEYKYCPYCGGKTVWKKGTK